MLRGTVKRAGSYRKASVVALASIALTGSLFVGNSGTITPRPTQTTYQKFFAKYCVQCHGPNVQRANLRLDTLAANFADPAIASKWAEVVRALNARQMPPPSSDQPALPEMVKISDSISTELANAEIAKRPNHVILRRLNRSEYNNTIRDLAGVDFKPADSFPEDPPAAGFDNIGRALTLSPLHMELYYSAARQVLDRALTDGPKPPEIKWHFEPEENHTTMDAYRVKRDGNNIILNNGDNPTVNGFTMIHHDSWNKGVDFRDFRLATEGEYIVRFRAYGEVPNRSEVVKSARTILEKRREDQLKENPKGKRWFDDAFEHDLKHFETNRMYDYGPPRVKMTYNLGGTPRVIAEMDVDATAQAPKEYEVKAHFTTQDAGIELHYAYDIPHDLENFWMQGQDSFARPKLFIDWIELEGPINPIWPPTSQRMILIDSPNKGKNERAYARDVIAHFMSRAYRRPAKADEITAKLALFDRLRSEKPSFIEAIKVPLAAILTSPHFLYMVEPEVTETKPRKLTAYELANRLSYFVWSSMPDQRLFDLAASGSLNRPEVLHSELDRMLASPKSDAFVKNFTGQWLGLRKVGTNPPVQSLYPQYDRHLEVSMVKETESFFREILQHDLDARNLIKSDFVTINERLARFYGISGVKGDQIRRVPVPASVNRGGIMTQASILSITSNGTRTSPVTRGVWVLRTLLNSDPGLPIANVGEIASKVPGIDKATVRQRLQIHRESPACARCHDKIDPLGFALENYNAAGEWRDREGHGYNGRIEENDPIIDASSKMPDGTAIVGVRGLQSQLLKKEDQFLGAIATQMTTYALGRELGFADQPSVKAIVQKMKREKYTLRSLMTGIVASPAFQSK